MPYHAAKMRNGLRPPVVKPAQQPPLKAAMRTSDAGQRPRNVLYYLPRQVSNHISKSVESISQATTEPEAEKAMFDGRKARRLREARGWTQEELAARVGIAPRGIREIESDRRQPRPETRRWIAEALRVPLSELIAERDRLPGTRVPPDSSAPNAAQQLAATAVENESTGNLEAAEHGFERLLQILEPDHAWIAWARERLRLNRDLRLLRRAAIKNPRPTLVPVLDIVKGKVTIAGDCEKEQVHQPETAEIHATCILIYQWPNGDIVYYKRQAWQSFSDMFDLWGGHMEVGDETPLGNCLRECNEELRLYVCGDQIRIDERWVEKVGEDFSLEWPIPDAPARLLQDDFVNRERSTLWVIRLPNHHGIEIRAGDDDVAGNEYRRIPSSDIKRAPLSELVKRRNDFADGGYRVFHKFANNRDFASLLERALNA